MIALVTHQEINNVRGITNVVTWIDDTIRFRNVDLRICSDDVADLASLFYTLYYL